MTYKVIKAAPIAEVWELSSGQFQCILSTFSLLTYLATSWFNITKELFYIWFWTSLQLSFTNEKGSFHTFFKSICQWVCSNSKVFLLFVIIWFKSSSIPSSECSSFLLVSYMPNGAFTHTKLPSQFLHKRWVKACNQGNMPLIHHGSASPTHIL